VKVIVQVDPAEQSGVGLAETAVAETGVSKVATIESTRLTRKDRFIVLF
jgi:hypothetical protein